MNRHLATTCVILALMMPQAQAQDAKQPVYGAQLEGFDYPHEVKRFQFHSQNQDVEMAFMDVAPDGEANGQTVVLMHGKNFCAATWQETISQLTTSGYRVIAPDQIGFCKSAKPAAYQFTFHQLAANTKSLLDSLKIEKAIVIGHSMGGMLATRYALNYPDHVERLVLVNPIGLEDWQALGVPYAPVDKVYQQQLKTTFDSIKAYQMKFYYHGNWKPEYDKWVAMQAGMYAGEGKEAVAWSQALTYDMLFTQPVLYEFSNLKMPVMLMIGGKDRTAPGANRASPEDAEQLGDYPELGRRTAAVIPGAVLVEWPDLGHSPQVEAPAIFHDELIKQLTAPPPEPAGIPY